VRDEVGEFLMSQIFWSISQTTFLEEEVMTLFLLLMEVMTLIEGLCLAKNKGCARMVFETDLFTLVDRISSRR